ncbi:Polysaccharide pyruvyl transferase [Caballeronia terrestris]|uniref:Polysaccharide pyruvyl transferase n=1 Tax=Caballeronia terrestris TaxID=1226301 RepID=A0A158KBB6_9BURK|nr:polysaccharide pyruvyl transferase family protein [Caballeronia terrestris]SAL78426.1 Polysaccharide pyruvyl transferase [Caballeronia terrestris]
MRPSGDLVGTLFIGAFDRHNFGDLLFAHVAEALSGRADAIFAGVTERDLRAFGGHRVEALPALATRLRDSAVSLVHVGGELLTCDVYEAAVMTLSDTDAQKAIARFDARPRERIAWARAALGTDALAPYLASREMFPGAMRVVYDAVGGVDLDSRDDPMRAEVLAKLAAADDLSVRDRHTQALLEGWGVKARLVPDSAVMVAELFGERIRERAREGAVRQVLRSFPDGYLAVQFSADFADDDTLARIASQLDRTARRTALGVVFFRAGAAPWHDDASCYERTAARMRTLPVTIFRSLNLWDICALIAHGRAYLGGSLHGRIVAMAFGLPRVNLRHPARALSSMTKQTAFAATWDAADMPAAVAIDEICDAIDSALATDEARRKRLALDLADAYHRASPTNHR